ncbi:MAG: ABC transporter ATP-binding protein [Chloroflexi bacterium]|nr:ABC transporter ATP-binding protein [Chloroflexota bacterium]
MTLIETVGLCQKYGEHDILRDVNLKVEPGETLALIGPTGAGKTTLLRLLNLLDIPASGRLYFDNADVSRASKARQEARRRMAFVLQKPVVFNSSVYDNVACGLKWRGVMGADLRTKVDPVLETVGLSVCRDRNARTLSGGETQRVAIARAIVLEPELLLLDEPTANLDPVSASKIEELIAGIIRQRQSTVIMATHDRSHGERLADRMAVLMNGELTQVGKSKDIFASPGSRDIAEFVGAENIIGGVIIASDDGLATIDAGGRLIEAISDYPDGEEVYACVRPENIILSISASHDSERNSFSGEIASVASMGPLCRIEVDCGFPLVALVTKRSAGELVLEKGKTVHAAFKATSVHVIRRQG